MDNYKYGPFFSSCLMNMMMRVDLIMVSNFSQANSVFDRTQVQTTSEDIRHIQTCGFHKMVVPQVPLGFNTKSCSSMTTG